MEKDKEFLQYIVGNIVDNPDEVQINRTIDERGVLLTLRVAPGDMGQIIGRDGNTAKAMRALLRTIGAKEDARVNLKIEEPEGSERGRREKEAEESEPAQDIDSVVEDLKL